MNIDCAAFSSEQTPRSNKQHSGTRRATQATRAETEAREKDERGERGREADLDLGDDFGFAAAKGLELGCELGVETGVVHDCEDSEGEGAARMASRGSQTRRKK